MAIDTTYNAKDCTITWDGIFITGVGEDFVTGSKDEEFFSTSVGAQGDTCVSENNNPLGTVKLTLQMTSPQKAKLLEDAKSGKIAPLWVTNKSISEKFGGTQARVKNYPELNHSAEGGDREFEFQVFDYDVQGL